MADDKPKKRGRPRLTPEQKLARGTYRLRRELRYTTAALKDQRPEVPKQLVPARDYPGIALEYVRQVAVGEVVACRWVKLACARQDADLRRSATDPAWPYVWDADEAIAACHFVESCPHVEGNSWATALIVLEPWQVFLVTALFGWRHRADRSRRRFTAFYLEVARKSAKSTLMATLGMYHMLREDEVGASVICAATTGKQARMVFEIMQKMVRKSPWLKAQGLEAFANAILAPDGSAKPVNSKASSLDGLNPSCIILDEGHAQDSPLYDVLKSAQGARLNPLLLIPTTAGVDLLSVGYALRGQVTKVLDGIYAADHILGAIYTLDDADDWRDPAVWIKACPMLGISPKLDYVTQYCLDCQQKGDDAEFRVKVCSQWAHMAKAWIPLPWWDACAEPTLRLEDFLGQPCWVGVDLAQLDDLAAVAYVFERGDTLVGFVRCYLPEGVVEERARAVPEYLAWVRDLRRLLRMTTGRMIDYDYIEADIRADALRFKFQEIVFDQHGSAQSASRLQASGLPGIIEPKNAKTFTPPSREFEVRIKHGLFRHDGNSLLRWAASNVVIERRVDGSILPKKEAPESPNKIDPIDALLSAIGAWLRGKKARKLFQMIVLGGPKP